ncbi:DUF817 domain-containing protein [Hydrocarboniphaga sp.]|jgi:uncharacterized membrane protein YoaT (DUF817 family)|uniref:DUF817 domain-containing protein n=2 Tax=Hydrocarboniphaga effusa TaxID=243629 RepID=I8HYN7_9GAMM|nr:MULTISPECIES: DUF817 domain-containing protein [Hydrocarboniphaga]EIT68581.1 hypothetical protein WQQ_37760 [Hydrocarboniphaga effusa AP103]MDZ4077070.1 DUF817 domain-containing protein [Hydrocarboniphaga sp.]
MGALSRVSRKALRRHHSRMLASLDRVLLDPDRRSIVEGWRRGLLELLWFGIKEARACLFAVIIFGAVVLVPKAGLFGLARYDLLLVIALVTQAWLLWSRLESVDEFKAIMVFHALGFALEAFKVSAAIGSWRYPDAAYSKLLGVPLFSGFMYAAVGSYMIQAWRLLDLRIERHPPYWMTWTVSILIYLNFFTHHYIADIRVPLAALTLGLYARCGVVFRPLDRDRRMPLVLAFVLIGFFLWLAENFGTFFGIWQYPNQFGAWATVHLGKWGSWSLLVIMTFSIVAQLKHIKATIQLHD